MLVLSRKKEERIMIGDDIVLTVLRTGKGRIVLGIEAPREVKIMREELLDHRAMVEKSERRQFE